MRTDYPTNRFEVKILETGRRAFIIYSRYEPGALGGFYTVEYEDGTQGHFLFDQVAPPEDPLHQQIIKWRTECRSRGLEVMAIGIKEKKAWTAYFAMSGPLEYQKIKDNHPNVEFKYYWYA